ncbi:BTB domain-containing protein [Mycena indigotica]|uniref:BTB domain-containing protein n=1 Tax=Mycena indigotica TaxID=2126181 RepID=A0A8H6S2D7_9AGAR|nr:BTB domain-containing protein [Mycena indigotica]KAF7291418.1 BTB domain-containing protein [Mycena indigotica]
MTEPPPKRKRSDSEAAVNLLTRSDVWFDDGNIVVQAQTTQFRVFRGTLAFHSPKLKALIDALPEDATLMLEEDPVDWEHVFKKLFHHVYPDKEPLPFAVIAAFARIGKKYEIEWLLRNAVERLNLAYPSTLSVWLSSDEKSVELAIVPEPPLSSAHATVLEHVLEASILARELNLARLLPISFWWLSSPARFSLLVTPRRRRALRSRQNVDTGWVPTARQGTAGDDVAMASRSRQPRLYSKTAMPSLSPPSICVRFHKSRV